MKFYEVPFGKREFAYWDNSIFKRTLIDNTHSAINLIRQYDGMYHCGMSISTYFCETPYLLFFPFDFDNEESITLPGIEALRTYILFASLGYGTYLSFSGKKGFHVVVETIPKPYNSRKLRIFHNFISKILRLITIDRRVKDIRRILRIPETFHIDTGNIASVIKRCEGRQFNIDKIIPISYNQKQDNNNNIHFISHQFPCIERYVYDREYWIQNHPRHTFQPSQFIRFSFIVLRKMQGFSREEILDEIRGIGWDDFDEEKTSYQINHIFDGGYVLPSCRRIEEEGYCIKEECPMYYWRFDNIRNILSK